ncbi:MAG: bifunctional DNA primase/polymerase [Pikeienuella sp.]|uniref:bifunctional DNA primase/polymerase n=1 Tax=Pikeienuella sp. TaxID=2831957 RepID=UPI00391BDCED
MAELGVFGLHAPEYHEAGLAVIPMDTRAKKPMVANWNKIGIPASRTMCARFAAAEGVGLVMGARSGLTEVDVDAVGEAYLGAALERFGESPVIIRTASGKAKIWYRHNGEARCIRPLPGAPIDVLGAGLTVAPPSWRGDLGAAYRFISGGLEDIRDLPTLRPAAFSSAPASAVRTGTRNDSLYRWCMIEARHCDDLEALKDAAETWAAAFPDPLSLAEIACVARSAWGYQERGRNFLGLKRPQATMEDVFMDQLLDAPDAFFLLAYFRRWHSNRPSFAIAPSAMSKAKSPPWHYQRIANARDVLLERGFIVELRPPAKGRRQVGLYRFAPKIADSVNYHYTPFLPSLPSLVEGAAR